MVIERRYSKCRKTLRMIARGVTSRKVECAPFVAQRWHGPTLTNTPAAEMQFRPP